MYLPQIPFPQIVNHPAVKRQMKLGDLRTAMNKPEAEPEDVDDVRPAWRTSDALLGALPTLLLALTGHGQDAAEFAQGFLGSKMNKAQTDTERVRQKAIQAAQKKNSDRQHAIDMAQFDFNVADQDYNRWQTKKDLEDERKRQKEEQDANKPKPDPFETDDDYLDGYLKDGVESGQGTPEQLLWQLRFAQRISPARYNQYRAKLEAQNPFHGMDAPIRKRGETYASQGIPRDRAARFAQRTGFMNDNGAQAMATAMEDLERMRQRYPDLAAGAYNNLPPTVLENYKAALRRAQGIVEAQAAPFHAAEQEWARQVAASAMNPVRLSILLTQRPVPNPGVKRYQDLYRDFHTQIAALPR